MSDKTPSISRRSFLKTTGALGALAAAGGALAASESVVNKTEAAYADEPDKIAWSQCNVNCGGNCIFQWHVRDGKVAYMETDNIGNSDFQARACLRGRTMRRWLNHPDRLLYPMKRVGPRGSDDFEQISWDEAINTIADKLKYTIDKYGNDAIYMIYATGMYSSTGNPSQRLMNAIGGCLTRHYDYSANQILAAAPYMFGTQFSPYDAVHASSMDEAANHSDLVVLWGNSPAETRMGGINMTWYFAKLREAVKARGGKIVSIDYRMNESISGHPDEWLPIRPGTDAALAAALIHEFVKDGKTDEAFLKKYCVGWNEDTMPKSAKGKHLSYKDYVMGTGYDHVEKTPEWASEITQIPVETIRALAKDLENAKAPFVAQGWGPQRHTNGENATRAICMVPIALGKIGLPGTNTGQREAEPPTYLISSIPATDADENSKTPSPGVKPNAVTWSIPCYEWLNAVDHGTDMSVTNAGVLDAEGALKDGKLKNNIHFVWDYAGNCITNQHSDINKVYETLNDDSKDLFILVWDTVMTDSARYADIILPDAMRSEQLNMQTQGYAEWYTGVTVGGPAQTPPGECRCSYDVMTEIADKMGVKNDFTKGGMTHDDWVEYLYKAGAAADKKMPSWEQIRKQGVYKRKLDPVVGLKDFRDDPKKNALGTPSGKIEIYSEQLEKLNKTWQLEDGEKICAIPEFYPGFEGYGSTTDQYPLYCTGFHHKSRTHSSYGFIEDLDHIARQQMWINPADAQPRGISNGDTVHAESPAGTIEIEARVTPRVIPGTVAIPQGAWHSANMSGDKLDKGGCVNTLTTYRPNPLSRGNGPANSIIVQVTKA